MPDAFLIGAGLSYGLTDGTIPLTGELYAILAGDAGRKSILDRYPSTRIDTILSYLDLEIASAAANADEANHKRLVADRSVLERAINEACSKDGPTAKSEEFCRVIPNGAQMFTFNYDLLLEETLWKIDRWSPKDGYSGVDPRLLAHARGNRDGIKLYKLHGSLNYHLYRIRGASDLFVEAEITEKDFPGLGGSASWANELKQVGYGIYPSYLKSYSIYDIRAAWRLAFRAIAGCERLFVLGYSFPAEDPLSNFLIDEYLGSPPALYKSVVILDIKAGAAAQRLKAATSSRLTVDAVDCDLRDATNTCRILKAKGV